MHRLSGPGHRKPGEVRAPPRSCPPRPQPGGGHHTPSQGQRGGARGDLKRGRQVRERPGWDVQAPEPEPALRCDDGGPSVGKSERGSRGSAQVPARGQGTGRDGRRRGPASPPVPFGRRPGRPPASSFLPGLAASALPVIGIFPPSLQTCGVTGARGQESRIPVCRTGSGFSLGEKEDKPATRLPPGHGTGRRQRATAAGAGSLLPSDFYKRTSQCWFYVRDSFLCIVHGSAEIRGSDTRAGRESLSVEVQIAEPSGAILIQIRSSGDLGAKAQGADGVRDAQAFRDGGPFQPHRESGLRILRARARWVPLYRRGCEQPGR